MTNRRWTALIGVMVALTVASCSGATVKGGAGTSAPPPSPVLPPRPAVLPLDKVTACQLLTDDQRQQLGVNRGKVGTNVEDPNRPACDWSNFPNAPDKGWVARIITIYGAAHALASDAGAEQVSVNGFPAVQTSAGSLDPNTNCLVFIDVAPGQTLESSFQNIQGDYPGLNHEVACQLAEQAGSLMIDTLKSLQG
jgi:hypothetical protein